MILKLTVYVLGFFLLTSCGNHDKNTKEAPNQLDISINEGSKEGLLLLKKHCYVCHSPVSISHDSIMAPPMAAVKIRYLRRYKNKEDFIVAMVKWTVDPKKEEGIMKGAIDRFGPMPKQNFKSEDLFKIATYVYENDLDEPDWFTAHFQEMQGP